MINRNLCIGVIRYEKSDLDDIIKKHQHWLYRDCEGWENMRANLHDADLRGANLCYTDLRGADLREANLTEANLSKADLRGANLSIANLSKADLRGVNLCDVDLHLANLNKADLRGANLRRANLCGAILSSTNLYGANLREANLCNTRLYEARIYGASFHGANLFNADLCEADSCKADLRETIVCSTKFKDDHTKYIKGEMLTDTIIGYKKCKDDLIVTLEIPRGAIVFSINGNKCRTNKAKVIAIDGATRAISNYKHFSYYVGDEITVYNFNCEYNVECGEGIHFFLSREEAENVKII